jgi:hypothetical protein
MSDPLNPLASCIWWPPGIDIAKRALSEQAVANVHNFFNRYARGGPMQRQPRILMERPTLVTMCIPSDWTDDAVLNWLATTRPGRWRLDSESTTDPQAGCTHRFAFVDPMRGDHD